MEGGPGGEGQNDWEGEPRYDSACDVYAMITVIWECFTRRSPYDGLAHADGTLVGKMDLIRWVSHGRICPMRAEDTEALFPSLRQLVQRGWSLEQAERPSAEEMLTALSKHLKEVQGEVHQAEELVSRASVSGHLPPGMEAGLAGGKSQPDELDALLVVVGSDVLFEGSVLGIFKLALFAGLLALDAGTSCLTGAFRSGVFG